MITSITGKLPPNSPYLLSFPDELEEKFQEDYFTRSIPIVRSAMLLGMLLYSLFGILDRLAAPLSWPTLWAIRMVVVVTMGVVIMVIRQQMNRVYATAILIGSSLLAGYGIITMILVIRETELGFHLYYAGLMLVIMWIYTFSRLRFVHATWVSWTIVAGYLAVALFDQRLLQNWAFLPYFVNNTFFFISASVIGMVSSYFLEVYARRDFSQRMELTQQNADLEAYARTVAHDLKNPLGIVVSYVSLIRQDWDSSLPPKVQARLATVESTGTKMVDIINNLLLLASVRTQKEMPVAPVDMDAVITAALSRLALEIERTCAEIERPAEWPVVAGYAPWVEEIWVNYLSNALKYGSPPPRIILGADDLPTGIRFWTKDNGRGLTEEQALQVFSEFERLENTRGMEGHGLGLSIVQRVAAKMGGGVGVESALGQGSLFYFTLPKAGA